jgi:hypothetical protein
LAFVVFFCHFWKYDCKSFIHSIFPLSRFLIIL